MSPPPADQPGLQLLWLATLAIPIAAVSWTITHEEILREPRAFCQRMCSPARPVLIRKAFYIFTCEYCFSHYVALFFMLLTRYRLLLDDWRGYVLAFFALVWMANVYMGIFQRLRVDIRSERAQADLLEQRQQDDGQAARQPRRARIR